MRLKTQIIARAIAMLIRPYRLSALELDGWKPGHGVKGPLNLTAWQQADSTRTVFANLPFGGSLTGFRDRLVGLILFILSNKWYTNASIKQAIETVPRNNRPMSTMR
jgi:hypothetical protein